MVEYVESLFSYSITFVQKKINILVQEWGKARGFYEIILFNKAIYTTVNKLFYITELLI